MRKFYEEVVLLSQAFVVDTDKTVEKALKAAEADVGAPIEVTEFVAFRLGEGVEKEESDFAAEVAAAAGTDRRERPEPLRGPSDDSPAPSCIGRPASSIAGRVGTMKAPARFRRVLLKVSGEALLGDQPSASTSKMVDRIAGEIGEAVELGVKVGARRRRRQHLPRHGDRRRRAATASPATIWACWRR